MLKGFRDFILRGNVIDLAVAFVVGVAFTAVVQAIATGIFNPLIASIFNAESMAGLVLPLPGGAELSYGLVLAALMTFLLTAAVVYFVFVMPINGMKAAQERRRTAGIAAAEEAAPTTELDLLTEIRDLLASHPAAENAKHTL